jgi:heme-degrading monooxygenase HmoA
MLEALHWHHFAALIENPSMRYCAVGNSGRRRNGNALACQVKIEQHGPRCIGIPRQAKEADTGGRDMIMRVYRCTVAAGKEAEFREFVYSKRHPWLRKQRGLIGFYAGGPLPDSGRRARCMVQIWESIAAIEAAIGEDWRQPPTIPEEARLFVESASVEHYEIADEFKAEGRSG